MRPVRASFSVALALTTAGVAARAQTAPLSPELEAQRRLLIEQAQQLAGRGDHAGALDAATRAAQLQRSTSLARFVAQEHDALAHNADAMRAAAECVSLGLATTGDPRNGAHVAACRALIASLEPRVGHVVLQPPEHAPAGLRITVAGHDVPAPLWRTPYVVDAGAVTIEATAEGTQPLRVQVQASAGSDTPVPLALVPAPTSATATATEPAACGPGTERRGEVCVASAHGSTSETAACPAGTERRGGACVSLATPPPRGASPLLFVGTGTAVGTAGALVVGIVGNVLHNRAAGAFNDSCYVSETGELLTVNPTCRDRLQAAQSAQTMGIAGYVVAGGLAATSVVLFVLSATGGHADTPPRAALSCAPGLAPGSLGLACGARF